MRLTWLTDIHLDFVETDEFHAFLDTILAESPDALAIGGDIAVSGSLSRRLLQMMGELNVPIYFVLGNHDYYYRSIQAMRETMEEVVEFRPLLCWLPRVGVVELTKTTALIGHGCWSDGRWGDFLHSPIKLNDYCLIKELSGITPMLRLERLKRLGDEAAAHVDTYLREALASYSTVYLLTHVPPCPDAAYRDGKPSDGDWAPHFTCRAVHDVICRVMSNYPNRNLIMLCGHSHGASRVKLADNIEVITGSATYKEPQIQRTFVIN